MHAVKHLCHPMRERWTICGNKNILTVFRYQTFQP
jgi:hypothetical protein